MDFDFDPYFKKYEALVRAADQAFERVRAEYPDCVTCHIGCSDCCHAIFDLTLIEAIYLNRRFNEKLQGADAESILEVANRTDRHLSRIKRQAFQGLQQGKDETSVLADLAEIRVRCPLLDDQNLCLLYDNRPLTCRLYGIPTAIGGQGHTCGLTAFKEGVSYPTVNLDMIHSRLQAIGAELISDMASPYIKLVDLLVPVSMALLTAYSDVYFGLAEDPEEVALRKRGRRKRKR